MVMRYEIPTVIKHEYRKAVQDALIAWEIYKTKI